MLALRLMLEAIHLRLVRQHARGDDHQAEREEEYASEPHGPVLEPNEASDERHSSAQAQEQSDNGGGQGSPQARCAALADDAERRWLHSLSVGISLDRAVSVKTTLRTKLAGWRTPHLRPPTQTMKA